MAPKSNHHPPAKKARTDAAKSPPSLIAAPVSGHPTLIWMVGVLNTLNAFLKTLEDTPLVSAWSCDFAICDVRTLLRLRLATCDCTCDFTCDFSCDWKAAGVRFYEEVVNWIIRLDLRLELRLDLRLQGATGGAIAVQNCDSRPFKFLRL